MSMCLLSKVIIIMIEIEIIAIIMMMIIIIITIMMMNNDDGGDNDADDDRDKCVVAVLDFVLGIYHSALKTRMFTWPKLSRMHSTCSNAGACYVQHV